MFSVMKELQWLIGVSAALTEKNKKKKYTVSDRNTGLFGLGSV